MENEDVNLYVYERFEYGEDDELPDCYKNPQPMIYDDDYDLATPGHQYNYTPMYSVPEQPKPQRRVYNNASNEEYEVGHYGTTEECRKSFKENYDPLGILESVGIDYDNTGMY